ncbi:hypothetical protein PV326_003998 [Microctonus aethiopoides]|nr:hypothetical protein PV326_003998 [Microctonus aethiopoides]
MKIVINFSKYPLKSTRHVSPCDDGYIYIPVAFMGMLYLVYLVECYHSPIRIDLHHSEPQDTVLSKLSQLKLAQPTIWWKAMSYHYVRRKRQIIRYRNGDHYTTTQVYYERVNTHAETSFYFYDYCGVKDISKDLALDSKIPITKITPSKGFAFSNMRSATEFEEARSRFFAEQELRDDYMEMREGLDLGYNFTTSTTLVSVFGRPWFTNSYVYWCLSALLLSWPLRIIIECNTQYADYQVTKLFGVNYDTPSSGEHIHASSSQLSAPGSYMLAPSYSEALLMEPSAPLQTADETNINSSDGECNNEMLVPSYSEALLYECANLTLSNNVNANSINEIACSVGRSRTNDSLFAIVEPLKQTTQCNCSCHHIVNDDEINCSSNSFNNLNEEHFNINNHSCVVCGINNNINRNNFGNSIMTRDISEPNLRTNSGDLMSGGSLQFLKLNGTSLENILENDEITSVGEATATTSTITSPIIIPIEPRDRGVDQGRGAIPKRKMQLELNCNNINNGKINCPAIDTGHSSDLTMADVIVSMDERIPLSKTYLCLKSILKPNKRRYTLVTTEELKNFVECESKDDDNPIESLVFLKEMPSKKSHVLSTAETKREYPHRTLIFASPIHEVCRPSDPFAVNSINRQQRNNTNENCHSLGKSLTVLTDREATSNNITNNYHNKRSRHHRTLSVEPEYLQFIGSSSEPLNNSTNCPTPRLLTRSLTERRPKPVNKPNETFRRSFADERSELSRGRRINLNMETSL